jgi:hypothetical protein
MRLHLALVMALLSTVAGCTSAISTTQSAETLKRGQVFVSAGFNVSIPASKVVDGLDQAYHLEQKLRDDPGYQPSEEEQQAYLTTALSLGLFTSGAGNEFMLRYGLLEHLDLGLRYSISGVHGDAKWQFLDGGRSGWHGAVSVGYQHHIFEGFVFDLLDKVDINDFKRDDLELPLLFGRSFGPRGLRETSLTDFPLSGRFWIGPKLILSRVHLDARLTGFDESLTTDGTLWYAGGVVGGAIGLAGIEAYAELTVMELSFHATVFDRDRDLGGLIVMPAFGLQGTF